jgi:hypothetical protein
VNTWPASLAATHNRGDAHEIVSRGVPGVTGSAVIDHVLAPPSGFVEISTPLACVPTHRWTDGQATSISPSGTANGSLWSISAGDDQVIVDATAEQTKHPSASAAAVSASPVRTMPVQTSPATRSCAPHQATNPTRLPGHGSRIPAATAETDGSIEQQHQRQAAAISEGNADLDRSSGARLPTHAECCNAGAIRQPAGLGEPLVLDHLDTP